MTRDGLVEQNLATGEETRISQREGDFKLGKKLPEASEGPKQGAKNPSNTHQNDTVEGNTSPQHETPKSPETARHSPKNARYTHQNGTENPANGQHASETGTSAENRQPSKDGRLRFTADEMPPDRKTAKLQGKSARTEAKLEKAREKLPTKTRKKKQRVYDEAKGKAKTKVCFEDEVVPLGKKSSVPVRAGKAAGRGITRTGANKIHKKISEVEHENAGVQAAHKAEQGAENTLRHGKRVLRFAKERPYRRVAKLEKKATRTNIKLDYRKALSNNPKLQSNPLSRMMQKHRIKRQYAKAAREARKAGKKTGKTVAGAVKAVANAITSHPGVALTLGALALVIVIIMTSVSSCSNMSLGGMGMVFGTSYLSRDTDIDDAELAYTEMETDLQIQVNNAESAHPGFDEYRYNVPDISHDPYELMAFLTAKYQEFTFDEVQPVLAGIFAEQYNLSFVEEVEVRYRTETYIDPATGEEYAVEVPYNWYVLNITLSARSFSDVVAPRLTGDEREIFNLLMRSKGNRQYAYSPFDFNWLPYVSSYYGWRVHPITGAKDYHKAVDIAVAQGTEIIAAQDGTVTAAAYDSSYGYYVAIDNGGGLVTKYAHCSQLLVSAGQQVERGGVIAKVGSTGDSTGPHLHFEVLYNGRYLNPLYFAVTNDDGSGHIPPGNPGGPGYGNPGAAMGDGSYAALIAEAEKHLGKPYRYGANGPDSFDCSSFVCWVYTQSGVRSLPRTSAQGVYNQCTPIPPGEARPGDIIFFTGTYSTPNAVSHVGIYVGDGMMIHAGSPIQYTSINNSYWQSHFFAFARIN